MYTIVSVHVCISQTSLLLLGAGRGLMGVLPDPSSSHPSHLSAAAPGVAGRDDAGSSSHTLIGSSGIGSLGSTQLSAHSTTHRDMQSRLFVYTCFNER